MAAIRAAGGASLFQTSIGSGLTTGLAQISQQNLGTRDKGMAVSKNNRYQSTLDE